LGLRNSPRNVAKAPIPATIPPAMVPSRSWSGGVRALEVVMPMAVTDTIAIEFALGPNSRAYGYAGRLFVLQSPVRIPFHSATSEALELEHPHPAGGQLQFDA
jgi:hypothetical protein